MCVCVYVCACVCVLFLPFIKRFVIVLPVNVFNCWAGDKRHTSVLQVFHNECGEGASERTVQWTDQVTWLGHLAALCSFFLACFSVCISFLWLSFFFVSFSHSFFFFFLFAIFLSYLSHSFAVSFSFFHHLSFLSFLSFFVCCFLCLFFFVSFFFFFLSFLSSLLPLFFSSLFFSSFLLYFYLSCFIDLLLFVSFPFLFLFPFFLSFFLCILLCSFYTFCLSFFFFLSVFLSFFPHFFPSFFSVLLGSVWIHVISHIWLASYLGKNSNIGCYVQSFQPKFLYACQAHRHNWQLAFYVIFSDFDFGWGSRGQRIDFGWESQGQRKVKSVSFIFLSSLLLIRKKNDVMLHILILHWVKFFE